MTKSLRSGSYVLLTICSQVLTEASFAFQMMKEWANARQKVLELKEVDPKAADQLNQEITSVGIPLIPLN